MVLDQSALTVEPPTEDGLKGVDRQGLMESDWVAYDFANSKQGRELLGIPKGVQFYIEPRLLVEREYFHRQDAGNQFDETVGECLFKVWWYQLEKNNIGSDYPAQRQIVVGTTMAWDHDTGKLRVILSTGNRDRHELAEQRKDRDLLLARLVEGGFLRPSLQRLGPDGRPLRFAANIETSGQAMRVSNITHMLHFIKEV